MSVGWLHAGLREAMDVFGSMDPAEEDRASINNDSLQRSLRHSDTLANGDMLLPQSSRSFGRHSKSGDSGPGCGAELFGSLAFHNVEARYVCFGSTRHTVIGSCAWRQPFVLFPICAG